MDDRKHKAEWKEAKRQLQPSRKGRARRSLQRDTRGTKESIQPGPRDLMEGLGSKAGSPHLHRAIQKEDIQVEVERERGDMNSTVQAGLLLNLRGTPLSWPAKQRKEGL